MHDKDELENQFTGNTYIQDLANDFTEDPKPEPPPMSKEFFDKKVRDELQPWHSINLQVQKLPHYEGLPPLKQATPGSVGIDLYAAQDRVLLLNSIGATVIVPTGIKIQLPHGFEAQIRPRSGLAANEGITVLNSPGTIDSDYRGEIKVILTKFTTGKARIERGMRIAQMVIAPVVFPTIEYVDCVDDTSRGSAGFGSTGTK